MRIYLILSEYPALQDSKNYIRLTIPLAMAILRLDANPSKVLGIITWMHALQVLFTPIKPLVALVTQNMMLRNSVLHHVMSWPHQHPRLCPHPLCLAVSSQTVICGIKKCTEHHIFIKSYFVSLQTTGGVLWTATCSPEWSTCTRASLCSCWLVERRCSFPCSTRTTFSPR